MKVIFLDIDGVMNSHVFFNERQRKPSYRAGIYKNIIISRVKRFFRGEKHQSLLDYKIPDSYYKYKHQIRRLKTNTCQQKWEWLSEFCNEEDVKICVSSVWRSHFGDRTRRLPNLWNKALTDLGFKEGTFVGITETSKTLRGEEIQDWLDKHPEVTDYAILDDDSDMLPEQMEKFHHCDGWFGMSPNHLYRIKRQFDNKSTYGKLSKSLN